MRLGGPILADLDGPDAWVEAMQHRAYRAAYCPVKPEDDDATVEAYLSAAAEANIVIAEVGAWSNPIGPDPEQAAAALELNKQRLALADRVGARCCVNISGSRGEQWAGHHPDNLTDATFDLVVRTVQTIIDAVRPTRTYYTLETMPWAYPDSVDSYVRLIEAIDRDRFAVHMDPVNLVSSPQRYYANAEMIRESFAKLGPLVRSCHAKDIALSDKLTVHLDEVRPGTGALDYAVYLQELDQLDPDTPLMLEHLSAEEDYAAAADHIRRTADSLGIAL